MEYKGYTTIKLSDYDLALFYEGAIKLEHLEPVKENQYVLLANEAGEIIDYYIMRNGELEKIKFPFIKNDYTGQMKPRNPQQYCALDLLKREDIPVKLLTGTFGSGKTMACINAALEAVQNNKFEKIIFIRNNVQVRDTDAIGALPGLI